MKYVVYNTDSAATFGVYEGDDAEEAIQAMLADAGVNDTSDLPEGVEDIAAEEVTPVATLDADDKALLDQWSEMGFERGPIGAIFADLDCQYLLPDWRETVSREMESA